MQYETPVPGGRVGQRHARLLGSDGTHPPHFDRCDRFGGYKTTKLPARLAPEETLDRTFTQIKDGWRQMRQDYYRGLR